MRKADKQRNKINHSKGLNRRGIDYRPVQEAARSLADWLVDVATDDVKGWREGERRLGDVRRYLHARIVGDDAHAPSEEALLFAATQLARAFASDPRFSARVGDLVGEIEPLLPMALGALARGTRGNAPPCATPPLMPLGVPMPVRPPGVPLSVPVPVGAPRRGCFQLRAV